MTTNEIKAEPIAINDGELLLQAINQTREVAMNKKVTCSVQPETANAYAEKLKEVYPILRGIRVAELKGALKPYLNQILLSHIMSLGIKLK